MFEFQFDIVQHSDNKRRKPNIEPEREITAVALSTHYPQTRYVCKRHSQQLTKYSNPIYQPNAFFSVLPYDVLWIVLDNLDLFTIVHLKRTCTTMAGATDYDIPEIKKTYPFGKLSLLEAYIVKTYLLDFYSQTGLTQNFITRRLTQKPASLEPLLNVSSFSPLNQLFQFLWGKVVPLSEFFHDFHRFRINDSLTNMPLITSSTDHVGGAMEKKKKHFRNRDPHLHTTLWDVYAYWKQHTVYAVFDQDNWASRNGYSDSCEISCFDSHGVRVSWMGIGSGVSRILTPLSKYDLDKISSRSSYRLPIPSMGETTGLRQRSHILL